MEKVSDKELFESVSMLSDPNMLKSRGNLSLKEIYKRYSHYKSILLYNQKVYTDERNETS